MAYIAQFDKQPQLLDKWLAFTVLLRKLTILFTLPYRETLCGWGDGIQDTDKASPQVGI
jgi:hypothetical protein